VRRLLLLNVLIYALLILGLASANGVIIASSIPLVIHLTAALFYAPQNLQLQVIRTLNTDRVSQGVPVTITVSITNHGSHLEEVMLEDVVPDGLEVMEGIPCVRSEMSPGQSIILEYTVCGVRGRHAFQDVKVRAIDRLGLFHRQAVLHAPAHLIVLPHVTWLRRVSIRPLQTHGYAGPVPARLGGSGVDFFGVRTYQLGDPMRWINWRLSARHPHAFFTNEFEQERIADVGLILDARQRSEVRVNGQSLFEHAVHATASLANVFLNDGNRVGLLVYGGFLDWIFPGYGKMQRERILQALARAEPGESMIFDKLEYIPTRFFPARSQIVLISPLWKEDLPILIRLRARGYQLLVISQDPVSFEAQALGSDPLASLATRIARLERTLLIRKARQIGIQIVNWQVDQPFDHAVHATLGRIPLWFRAVGLGLRG
jgi:uncharacterized protein (DUF58 family)